MNKIKFIFLRYIILIIIGLLYVTLYKLLFYVTIFPSYFLLKIFYEVSIEGYILNVVGTEVGVVSACVAGSAYYLLLILNLTTEMKTRKRLFSLLFSLVFLLIVNIIRISAFSMLLVEDFVYFDIIHSIFWHLMSVLLVIFIWFLTVWIFKIKNIPVYSDLRLFFRK